MATYYVRTDGNDTNTGTGPTTNQAWQTVQKALGASGIGVGDTLYIAPGVYRESVTAAFTNPASEGQRVTISGDPTCSQFTGITAGPVIVTNYLNASGVTGNPTLVINKSYVTIQNIYVTGYATGGSPTYGSIFLISGTSNIVTSCSFYTPANNVDMNNAVIFGLIQSTTGFTVSRCVFLAPVRVSDGSTTTSAWNSQSSFTDCIFQNPSAYVPTACLLLYSPSGPHIGGITVQNCRFIGNTGIAPYPGNNMSAAFPIVVRNCIFETSIGITASTNNGQITQSYNIFNCGTALTNVATSGTSWTRAFISPDFNMSRITGWANYPFWSNHASSASQNAGTSTGAPATDMFGVTWNTPSTPTIGSVEASDYSSTGRYVPTERNASTITIAPGSTSQSIELYLGATGLTASTSGLSARYNRTRTASVSIPLVARTIAQAWTAGGFAEVDATNMPGVYRLDVPDAALASGADDVTIVVRGASGTNGAVMTVKLSSGGLSSTETAQAVWNATASSYNTAGSMGEAGQKLTGYSLASSQTFSTTGSVGSVTGSVASVTGSVGSVTAPVTAGTVSDKTGYALSSSQTFSTTGSVGSVTGTVGSVTGSVGSVTGAVGSVSSAVTVGTNNDKTGYALSSAGNTASADAVWNATRSTHTTAGTFGQYVNAELVTPVSQASLVYMGPFQVIADGVTTPMPLDVQLGAQHGIAIQCVDNNLSAVSISGATVTAKVYNSGGSLIDTYSCTATYAADGRATFTIDTTVTGTAGTYTATITRTTGASDTQVFGPLRIYVRDI